MANQEPENLSREELLRIENIALRRELLNQQDSALLRDIARAHMLEESEFGQTWSIRDGRIVRVETEVQVDVT